MLGRVITVAVVATCMRTASADPVVTDADALWGGSGAFCVRTSRGLACWTTWTAGSKPAIVQIPQRVTEVALQAGAGCALAGDAVWCFSMSALDAPRRIAADHPRQVVAVGGGWFICVLDAKGVTCRHSKQTLTPVAGHPRRIFASLDGSLCAVFDDRTRCYPAEADGFGKTVNLPGVTDPTGVLIMVGANEVYLVEHGVLRHGDRLDATGEMITRAVPGIGRVTAMAAMRVYAVVLDDQGVAAVFQDRILNRWRTATALWPQDDANGFLTREADKLHVHALGGPTKWTDETPGFTAKPAAVSRGRYATCVLDGHDVICEVKPPRF